MKRIPRLCLCHRCAGGVLRAGWLRVDRQLDQRRSSTAPPTPAIRASSWCSRRCRARDMASLCTGEVISPHVVLTAAHCVDPATVGANAKTVVFIGDVLTQTSPSTDFLTVQTVSWDMMFDRTIRRTATTSASPCWRSRRRWRRCRISATRCRSRKSEWRRASSASASPGQRHDGHHRRHAPSGADDAGQPRRSVRRAAGRLARHLRRRLGRSGVHDPRRHRAHHRRDVVRLPELPADAAGGHAAGIRRGQRHATLRRLDVDSSIHGTHVRSAGRRASGDDVHRRTPTARRGCARDEGDGKVCVQSCDPAAMPASCPAGTTCTASTASNVCLASSSGGGSGGSGGSAAAPRRAAAAASAATRRRGLRRSAGLLFAVVALVALAVARVRRPSRAALRRN